MSAPGPVSRTAPRRARLWTLLGLVVASVAPFVPALENGFTFDDGAIIQENPAVWAASASAAWTEPYWPGRPGTGLYRPWTTLSYWVNARIGGRSPRGFHAVNLLLHLATVLLLHRLLRRLFPERRRLPLIAALLFAVHPLHSEAIVSVVGRAELWAAGFGLGGWLLAIRFSQRGGSACLLGAAVLFALALLSKESAAGLLLLPCAHLILDRWGPPPFVSATSRRRWFQILGGWGAALVGVLLLRARVLGGTVALGPVSLSDNALAHQPAWGRVLNALGIQWLIGWRTIFPWRLTADASYPQIVPGAAWTVAGALMLALVLFFVAYAGRRRDRDLLWGLGIVLAGGFVTSNIPFAVGTIYGERLAYLPSAGSIWILSLLAARIAASRARAARLLWALAIVWGIFLAARSWVRCPDWKDDSTLFRATTATSPRSAKAWTNLAVALLEGDRVPEALAASGRALDLLPGYPAAREARGTALTRSGRPAEAVEILRPALSEPAPRPRSLIELGNAWLTLKSGAAAESAFAAAARALPPHDPRAAIGFASALALQGRWNEAARAWRHVAVQKPDDAAVQRSFAYSLWMAGAADSAEAIYRILLARDDRDAASRNELAWLLARSGRVPREAVSIARTAYRLQPDPNTADTLLESLIAAGDHAATQAWIDSLAASPPPALDPGAISALRERWEQRSGSGTLGTGETNHPGRNRPLPED